MGRYIDATMAYNAVINVVWDDDFWIPIDEALDNVPTADVRENVHGKWVKKDGETVCSECGKAPDGFFAIFGNYCVHCGADMRERNNNEEHLDEDHH